MPEPLTAKPSTVSFAVEQGAPYHPDEAYQVLSGERPAPEEEQTLQDKANEHEAQRYARESKRSRKRSELLAELEKAKQTPMGKATQPLSDYEAALVAFHHRPEYALERWKKSGQPPKMPAGLADVFRAVLKHGARANGGLYYQLQRQGSTVLYRKDAAQTFDHLVLYMICNTCLSTRSFSLRGTQSQIGEVIGKSQSTVSRWFSLLIKCGLLRHAFIGDNLATDPRGGLVHDKTDGQKRNLNNVYVLTDDFGVLVGGETAGKKLYQEFEAEDKLAIQEGAGSLPARLAILRNTLWEGTIERRNQAIGAASTKQKVQQTNDRSRALSLVVKKMLDEGLDRILSKQEFEVTANTRLKHLGFSPTASPPETIAA
ncbi:hypothetical protein AB6D93_23320 [Vibrio sp. 10N.247.310.23]|uniref:hypothetical protein n=1 Tax=Vibrio sp. 10N.247.310.23 TaxID=3229983 RepID=UPI00354FB68D